jgi:hypothetical protein
VSSARTDRTEAVPPNLQHDHSTRMSPAAKRTLILAYFVGLFVLHQDFWWKDDPTLVLGVLPVSLAYHVLWTLLVALGWWWVTRFCWPHQLDEETPAPQRAPTDAERPPR